MLFPFSLDHLLGIPIHVIPAQAGIQEVFTSTGFRHPPE